MSYAYVLKVEDRWRIINGPCAIPREWEEVHDFHLLSKKELKKYNWAPVIDRCPQDLDEYQQARAEGYIFIEDSEGEIERIEVNYTIYESPPPNINHFTQIIDESSSGWRAEGNKRIREWVFIDLPTPEIWDRVRIYRNGLLNSSDWTQVMDRPDDEFKREWAIYRQKLRDIPQNCEDPRKITWPEQPNKRRN